MKIFISYRRKKRFEAIAKRRYKSAFNMDFLTNVIGDILYIFFYLNFKKPFFFSRAHPPTRFTDNLLIVYVYYNNI